MTIEDKGPFIRFLPPVESGGRRAVSGFSVVSGVSPEVKRQVTVSNLVNVLRRCNVAALELRMTKGPRERVITSSLLCYLRCAPKIEARMFPNYCVAVSQQVRLLFLEWGFEIKPYVDEAALLHVLMPLRVNTSAGARREDELCVLRDDESSEYEVYAPYPWEWCETTPWALSEVLARQRGYCSASLYLRSTERHVEGQFYLEHATAMKGVGVSDVYQIFAGRRGRPYVVRMSFTAASKQELMYLRQALATQLPMNAMSESRVRFQGDGEREKVGLQYFGSPEWLPWKNQCDGGSGAE